MAEWFAPLIAEIATAVEPLYRLLYSEGQHSLMTHSSHAIGYGLTGQRELKLKLHVDDSRLTVNLCLGCPGFNGSELYFTGSQKVRFPPVAALQRRLPAGSEVSEARAVCVPGRALLHLGCHPHRTVPIKGGSRINWVLWMHEEGDRDVGGILNWERGRDVAAS